MSGSHRHSLMLIVLATLALAVAAGVAPRAQSKADLALKAAMDKEVVDGDLRGAVELYRRLTTGGDRAVAAQALVRMGRCYEKLGDAESREARRAYEQVVREFGDQPAMAAEARARLAALAGAARGSTLTVRLVWEGPEVDLEGGVSPDGRHVAFIDWSTGDLAVRDLTRGETRRLTKNGPPPYREYADFAAFSPDGGQLVYAWCREDGTYDLRIIGVDGTGQRVLHRSPDFTYFLPIQWSRDGRNILSFVGQKGGIALALVSASDGAVRVVKTVDWRLPQGASLSPDGRWLAYDFPHGEDSWQYDIHLLATDGSVDVPLVEHPSSDTHPIWTPDGKQILFVSDRGGTLGLWAIPVLDGRAQGEPQLIKPDVGRIHPFRISDTGAFHFGLTAGTGDVYEIRIDPKSGKPSSAPTLAFKHYVGFNGTPDYSPDGQLLAGISVRGSTTALIPGNRSLVVRALKTGEEREIPLSFAPGWELKWSPDNRFVLIPGRDMKGRISTYQVDVRTGAANVVSGTGGMNNQQGPQRGWFPDQKSIYLVAGAPQDDQGRRRSRLVRQDLASQKIEDLFLYRPDQIELCSVNLSPDGRQFAAWRRDLETSSVTLVLIPATGGEPRQVVAIKDVLASELLNPLRGLSWTPDGRYLIYARRSMPTTGATDLWRVSVLGGEPENLGPLPDHVFDVVVHPGGERIAFSTRQLRQEVWVMENFLPTGKRPPAATR